MIVRHLHGEHAARGQRGEKRGEERVVAFQPVKRRIGIDHVDGPLGPRGPEDGPPALVIPGFLATARTTMELRRALARGGWRAHPWLLGTNGGAKANTMELLGSRLQAVHDGRPVLLVGWSLGGVFARELAREVPQMVRALEAGAKAAYRIDDASEIGRLQVGFNAMTAGLAERERIREVFGTYVDRDVAGDVDRVADDRAEAAADVRVEPGEPDVGRGRSSI